MSHRPLVQAKTDKGVRSGRLAGAGPRNWWTAGDTFLTARTLKPTIGRNGQWACAQGAAWAYVRTPVPDHAGNACHLSPQPLVPVSIGATKGMLELRFAAGTAPTTGTPGGLAQLSLARGVASLARRGPGARQPRLLLLWLALLCGGAPAAMAAVHDLQMSGSATSTSFMDIRGVKMERETWAFTVYRSGCKWLIHVAHPGTPSSYYEMAYDGETQYRYLRNYAHSQTGSDGVLLTNQVPKWTTMETIPFLWLGLCSDCYFQTNTLALSPPYDSEPWSTPMKIEASLMDRWPRLPERIAFYAPTPANLASGAAAAGDAAPLYAAAIFHATNPVTVGALRVPHYFELVRYRWPDVREHRTNLIAQTRWVAGVEVITDVCDRASFAPDLPAARVTLFNDLRFTSPNTVQWEHLDYGTNHWLSVEEARALPGFAVFAAEERRWQGVRPPRNPKPIQVGRLAPRVLLAWVVLVVVALGGGAAVCARTMIEMKRKTRTE